ncbi:hypothetical protein BC829DRAFT_389141 [Chytridium lagenaria]|nr:hypothetical protein BC829DRAFT_389141 [Chytridium lagenaria]
MNGHQFVFFFLFFLFLKKGGDISERRRWVCRFQKNEFLVSSAGVFMRMYFEQVEFSAGISIVILFILEFWIF